ncbi:MAG: hypothetical protein BWY70_01489 [Bacteroidetes bacterium ADurb.Bin408]|nr:MAG: hypothetical protein BWY70_01489 [Bacteroidetes bacterium ADurb.Bin408]
MKKILIIILVVFMSYSFLQAQDSAFDVLKLKFEQGLSLLTEAEADNFVGFPYNEELTAIYTQRVIYEDNRHWVVTFLIPCISGGTCERTALVVFSKEGKRLDRLYPFEINVGEINFLNKKYCSMALNGELFVANDYSETNMDNGVTTENMSFEFIRINEKGKISAPYGAKVVDNRRPYNKLSIYLLTEEDLQGKKKEELETMKNEIYAAHGLKFKEEKWDAYFGGQAWYKRERENVDAYLNMVEKKNAELLTGKISQVKE